MMRRWCQCKEEEGPHLHTKTPRHADTSSKSPYVDDDEGASDAKEYPSNQEAPPTPTPSKDASTSDEEDG